MRSTAVHRLFGVTVAARHKPCAVERIGQGITVPSGNYVMLSFIIPPPPVASQFGTSPPIPVLLARGLDPLDMRIVDETRRSGCYGAHIWKVLCAVARDEAPANRKEQRQMRLALWVRLQRLLRQGALFRFGRYYVTTKKIKREPALRRKRALRAGSALGGSRDENAATSANQLNMKLLAEIARYDAERKTESGPLPIKIEHAARLLARMPRRKQPTGRLNGQPAWRGKAIRLRDGREVYLWGCRSHRVVWSRNPDMLLLDLANPNVGWGVVPEREVTVVKNRASATLGRLKRGVREQKSERKARAARINGSAPPRPGSRPRGRPPQVSGPGPCGPQPTTNPKSVISTRLAKPPYFARPVFDACSS